MNKTITEGSYKVRLDEVNNQHQLTAAAAIGYLQEAAWKASVEWGVSINDLMKEGFTWILSRLAISVHELPSYLDEITFETWISRYEKIFSHRDMRFRKNENTLFEAASQWLVMDINSKKLTRLPENLIKEFLNTERTAFDFFKNKIPDATHFEHQYKMKVRWHDLDINQHTNNKHYFRWALDALPAEILNEKKLVNLDFQFKGETLLDDELVVLATPTEQGFLHKIVNAENKEIIKGISFWK
jgi:medium-chain acyl-[acyl-carrier-protein] hydrolase